MTIPVRGRLRAAALALLALTFSLALGSPESLAASAATSAAPGGTPVTIAVLPLASSGAIFIAQDKGYFAAEGLNTKLEFLDAAQPVALAVVAGDADFGATGLTAGFYNLAGKGALRIIGAQSREEPSYHLIAYLASNAAYAKGLTGLADLPGHSVAITQVGSTFYYSLGLIAAKLDFPLARLRMLPLQSMSNMAAALKGGQADAALLPGTIAQPMVARGEAHLLGWVGDETPWQVGALFTTAKTVETRRPLVEKFLAAYRRGAHDLFTNFLEPGPDGKPPAGLAQEGPEAPALLKILAKYTHQPPARLQGAIPFVDPGARLLVADVYHQIEWYQQQGLVDKNVSGDTIIATGFADTGSGAPAGDAAPSPTAPSPAAPTAPAQTPAHTR